MPAVKSPTRIRASRRGYELIDAHASLPGRKLWRHGIAAYLACSACPGCQCCSYYDPVGADGQSCGGDFARIRWSPGQVPGRGWWRGPTPAIATSRDGVSLSGRIQRRFPRGEFNEQGATCLSLAYCWLAEPGDGHPPAAMPAPQWAPILNFPVALTAPVAAA